MFRKMLCLFFIFVLFSICIKVEKSQAEENLIPFEKEGKWGYMDEKGEVVIKPQFIIVNEFSWEGIASVADESGWAYIDTRGKIVIRPYIFDNGPDYFREGLARFTEDNRFGFFDKRGKVVIENRFDFAWPFSEGLAAICMGCKRVYKGEHWYMEGGRWGYLNKKGEIVIPLKFDWAGKFEKGRAKVMIDGKFVYIDKKE